MDDKKLYLLRAECDLNNARRFIKDALSNVEKANRLGFMDFQQIQEFSGKADSLIHAATDGLHVEIKGMK